MLGVVENMSYFVGDDGKEYDLFGRGGAEVMAQTMNVPFLGSIPIIASLREHCDLGTPLANWEGANSIGPAIDDLCRNVASRISIASMQGRYIQPTLSVS